MAKDKEVTLCIILNCLSFFFTRKRDGHHFFEQSEGWSIYQFLESRGKERQASKLLLLQSDGETQMRRATLPLKKGPLFVF